MRTFNVILTLSLTLLSHTVSARQVGGAPFAEFDRQVKTQQGNWAGDKGRLSGYFNEERKKLGNRFEPELMKYLRGDAEKHYWISFFLESPSYLHGNTPLPHLSLLIKEQGLSLVRKGADEESRGYVVGLGVTAAVLAEQLGLGELAVSHKAEAERLLAADKGLSGYFPAMMEEEHALYRPIGTGAAGVIVSSTGMEEDASMPKARVMGGVLNGKAVSKPLPAYPAEARAAGASGEVRVQVVIDESGEVIWAKAAEGHELLRGVAEEAARRATFQPTTVQGKPEKVMGFLLYRFVP